MALLYIHLPFCRSKCRYCDFYSLTTAGESVTRYIDALAIEWTLRTQKQCPDIETIYIGGGTPSLLSCFEWEYLAKRLFEIIPKAHVAEWTVECNPDSFTDEKAQLLAGFGVNRLTVGVQSLRDRELLVLGRPHTAAQARAVLTLPSLSRFRSIGIDVMYGIPGQTITSFEATLGELCTIPSITHLSAYELTIADGTPFDRHYRLLPLPDEEAVAEMAELLFATAPVYGFLQYEISNFAREGFRCRHNCGYWDHEEYIGLGTAAHSYCNRSRTANVCAIDKYCSLLEKGILPTVSSEYIDGATLAREILFLGFRTVDGIDERAFEQKTGIPFSTALTAPKLERFVDEGLLCYAAPWWRPTRKGLMRADYLARELF